MREAWEPTAEMECEHLAKQCADLLQENQAMRDALLPFEALLDLYEATCGDVGRIMPWTEFIEEYAWPSEQDCINARKARNGIYGPKR